MARSSEQIRRRLIAGTLLAGGATAVGRSVARRRTAIDAVAPELRNPVLYLPLDLTDERKLAMGRALLRRGLPPVAGVDIESRVLPGDEGGASGPRVVVYERPDRERPSGCVAVDPRRRHGDGHSGAGPPVVQQPGRRAGDPGGERRLSTGPGASVPGRTGRLHGGADVAGRRGRRAGGRRVPDRGRRGQRRRRARGRGVPAGARRRRPAGLLPAAQLSDARRPHGAGGRPRGPGRVRVDTDVEPVRLVRLPGRPPERGRRSALCRAGADHRPGRLASGVDRGGRPRPLPRRGRRLCTTAPGRRGRLRAPRGCRHVPRRRAGRRQSPEHARRIERRW